MEENLELNEQVAQEQSNTIENMSDSALANAIASRVNIKFAKHMLIKELPAEKVQKELTKPEPTGEQDEDGNDIMEMKTTLVEVDSVYRTGVVISMPASNDMNEMGCVPGLKISAGDKVCYRAMASTPFDLFKDSVIVEPYQVIGKVN